MHLKMFALVAIAVTANVAATAGESNRRQRACCPRCGEACYRTVSVGKEKKHCWVVDTKTICIPKVRFPWERDRDKDGCCKKGCPSPKSGRTKCVRVLLKCEYECEVCKYHWDEDTMKRRKRNSQDVPPPPPVEARKIAPQKSASSFFRVQSPVATKASESRKGNEGSSVSFLK